MFHSILNRIVLGQMTSYTDEKSGIGPIYFIVAIIAVLAGLGLRSWFQGQQLKRWKEREIKIRTRREFRNRPVRPIR